MTDAALAYAQTHAEQFRDQLKELLRIPSISTMTEHARDVRRAAEWLTADMMRIGLDTAEVILMDEGRCPLVFGEWMGAGEDAPTVLVYCHYDVQPADRDKDGWDSDPFDPLERDGKIYARGAVDSKSHVIAQLKAIESMLATETKSPVNIKVIFEGEEESGSENINAFIPKNIDRLQADVCVVSDGSMPDREQPVVDYGLRGIVTMELEVFGPARDLHSGHYGGNVHNPLHALADIIHQLHNPDGSIAVPGFYDNVVEIDDEERSELRQALPWVEEEWKIVTGASSPWGESQYTLLERASVRPTLEINGMAGGFYADGFKTVLPAKAIAKISCRLVPHQQPQRIFELLRDYITEITPPTVQTEMRMLDMGAPAVLLDRKSSSMQAAMNAYEQAWGVRPLLMREGGSIPVMAEFQQHLGIPMVSMPFGFKGCGAHGPNEHVYTDMFHKGIATMIYFYQELTK